MDELRLILLLIGAAVIAGVYLYSRRQGSRRGMSDLHGRDREPRVNASGDDNVADDMPENLPPLRAVDADEADDVPSISVGDGAERRQANETTPGDAVKVPVLDEKIIVLNVFPRHANERFPGSDLLDVFERAGLEYGQFSVFHRLKETNGEPLSVFSVASATEPGSFDITAMAEQEFRGLTMFMVLPGPMRGVDAFADMLATARRIAEQIRGEVKDRSRSTLTRQTAHHIREEIIAFEHRLQSGV